MAEISSYPQASPKGSDIVLGVQTYVEGDDSTIGNHTKTFTINDINNLVAQDSGSSPYITRVVELTPAQILSLNDEGVLELIPAPGAGKIIVMSEILFFLDYNSTAYDFSLIHGVISTAYGTSIPLGGVVDYRALLNKSSDYYANWQDRGEPKANQPLNLLSYGGVVVTQGDSPVKISIVYRILNSTTLL